VIRALIDAKRPFPIPVAGEAENAFRQYMLDYKDKGFKALSIGQPPFLGIIALYLATEVLQGKHPKADVTIPFPYVTQDTVKEGLTTFKDLPGSYFVDFTDSGPNASVIICKDAVLHGTPCPGKLAVRLP
jgi:ribose transport system substrate-binding protein